MPTHQPNDESANAKAAALALTARMAELGMGQSELEKKSTVSVATIHRLQKGEPHNYWDWKMRKLALALDMPSDWLSDLLAGKSPRRLATHARPKAPRGLTVQQFEELKAQLDPFNQLVDDLQAELERLNQLVDNLRPSR
jgi:transcriptional regulator with XRE-family HTH domain